MNYGWPENVQFYVPDGGYDHLAPPCSCVSKWQVLDAAFPLFRLGAVSDHQKVLSIVL
jgi:hypothetical protein